MFWNKNKKNQSSEIQSNNEGRNNNHHISRAPSQMGVAADTILTFKKDLFEMGRERALTSGDTRVNEEVLKSLEEHAEAMSKEQAAILFNPANSIHDQLRQEKYEQAKADLPRLEKEIALAEEDVRKRRDSLAELGEIPQIPEIPWFLFLFGSLLIGLTVAPTFHDFFFYDLEDQRLSWVLSGLTGISIGLFVSWCLLATFDATSRAAHYVGLLAGVIIGLALLLIRFISAQSETSLILAIGLALLEIAVVIYEDWVGKGLRQKYLEYDQKNKECERRFRLLQAAEKERDYRKAEKTLKLQIIDEYIQHIYERESRASQIANLIQGTRQAIQDGYRQGLAENEGRIHGPKF